MANNNYIGNNGLVVQTYDEILEDLTNQFKNIYGADINIDQNSPDGQWLNILAQEKKDILDLFTQYYNNLDVDRVIGIPQQILYKLNGLTIKAYTYSYAYVNVTVTAPVNLQGLDTNIENADGTGYTVVDTNGNRWILAESQSLQPGTYLLNFRAAQLGAVTALPNTINVMETIIAGVSGVNNPANNYVTGNIGESDSQYRLRRNQSMALPSQGFADSIRAQILNLPNVTECKVYQNRTSSTVNEIPPNTVWVIVEGGNSQEIGQIIYNNMPPGIPMKGDEEVQIVRPSGDVETVNYDLPNPTPLYILMNIKVLGGAIDEDYLKTQLSQLTFEIGQSAEAVNISTEVKNIIGGNGTPYDLEVSADGVTYSEIVSPAGLDDYFTISTDNINIQVVS